MPRLSVPRFHSQFIECDNAHQSQFRNHRLNRPLAQSNRSTGAEMSPNDKHRANRTDLILSAIFIVGGLLLSGVSMMQLASRGQVHFAQSTQPTQSTPSVPAGKSDQPAESMPGGTRPTTPAPEPARPDADAQKAGAKPALPPAPAEKMGEPVKGN